VCGGHPSFFLPAFHPQPPSPLPSQATHPSHLQPSSGSTHAARGNGRGGTHDLTKPPMSRGRTGVGRERARVVVGGGLRMTSEMSVHRQHWTALDLQHPGAAMVRHRGTLFSDLPEQLVPSRRGPGKCRGRKKLWKSRFRRRFRHANEAALGNYDVDAYRDAVCMGWGRCFCMLASIWKAAGADSHLLVQWCVCMAGHTYHS